MRRHIKERLKICIEKSEKPIKHQDKQFNELSLANIIN